MSGTCSVAKCSSPATTRGWCMRHYTRWLRHGDPEGIRNNTGRALAHRLWSKVVRGEGDGCWLWKGAVDDNGYGVLSVGAGELDRAHRVAWRLTNGEIPDGEFVCHDCPGGDNPGCCRPSHLYLGTQFDNMQDAAAKGRIRLPGLHGERHPQARLTEASVADIRARYTGKRREQSKLAREFGVTQATIHRVVKNKGWL